MNDLFLIILPETLTILKEIRMANTIIHLSKTLKEETVELNQAIWIYSSQFQYMSGIK